MTSKVVHYKLVFPLFKKTVLELTEFKKLVPVRVISVPPRLLPV